MELLLVISMINDDGQICNELKSDKTNLLDILGDYL